MKRLSFFCIFLLWLQYYITIIMLIPFIKKCNLSNLSTFFGLTHELQTWIQFQSECGKSDANIKNHKEEEEDDDDDEDVNMIKHALYVFMTMRWEHVPKSYQD